MKIMIIYAGRKPGSRRTVQIPLTTAQESIAQPKDGETVQLLYVEDEE